MRVETLPVEKDDYNLMNYDEYYSNFKWEDIEEHFSWHKTGLVNMAYEAIDKHAEGYRKNKIALFFKDSRRIQKYSFKEMKELSNKAANVLKDNGLEKGERIFIFLPKSPELYFSLLGSIKLGAIVGPLFEPLSGAEVEKRLVDGEAKFLVTTPELLKRVRIEELPHLEKIFLVGENQKLTASDSLINFNQAMENASKNLDITWVDSEDGLILHYSSGSTGTPKGVYHVHHAMVQHYATAKWVLDLKEEDIYWCTAEPGWITGTAYGIFAPWLVGATNVVVGGKFSPKLWYQTIQGIGVTVWYSSPTAFRMLMGVGNEVRNEYDLTSLRHILSVGEPLNQEIIKWGKTVYGKRIHDTWWMTETGGQMICNFPALEMKLGSMGKPIPGIEAAIVDYEGNRLPPYEVGNLAIRNGWPSMMRGIWNNSNQYESYFLAQDWFISGDMAYMDDEGYFWYQGRVDEVIISSGSRVDPFEIESKLMEHPAIAEAGVIGKPSPVYGEIIKAFIALRDGYEATAKLKMEIEQFIKWELANTDYAVPREIEFCEQLPKTRSGKIMRHVLKT